MNEKLEEARRDKKIGKSLEAYVEIRLAKSAESVSGVDLEELFIVSKVVLKPTEGEETITVTRAEDHGMKNASAAGNIGTTSAATPTIPNSATAAQTSCSTGSLSKFHSCR